VSADARRVATRSGDGRLLVWDMTTGALAVRLQPSDAGYEQNAYRLTISPDGKTLATQGRSNKSARLFDLATGKEVACLGGGSPFDFPLAFSRDGKFLAVGGAVWDVAARRVRARLPCPAGSAVALSADGGLLVTGSPGNHGVTVWEVATARKLHTFAVGDLVRGVALSPDGKVVAAALNRGVRRWELATGQELPELRKGSYVGRVAFAGDGVLAAADHSWARLFDTRTGRLLHKFRSGQELAATPDGKHLAHTRGGSYDVVALWDVKRGRPVRELGGHQGPVTALAWSPDGKRVVSGGEDNVVRVWDPAAGKELLKLPQFWDPEGAYNVGIWDLALLPNSRTAAVIANDHQVRLWDLAAGRELRALTQPKTRCSSVRASPDGKYLAAQAHAGDRIRLWEAASWKERPALQAAAALDEKGARADRFTFLADGRSLAALVYPPWRKGDPESPPTRYLVVWDVPSGRVVSRVLCKHPKGVYALTASADGRLLALSGYDGEPPKTMYVLLVETATGRERGRLPCSVAYHAAFAPDGWTLASGGGNTWSRKPEHTAVTLWDLATLTKLDELQGHRWSADRLAFSPDGTRLASGSADTSILIWDVARCARARRLPPLDLAPADLQRCWGALAGTDGKAAHLAIKQLARGGGAAATFLARRVEPARKADVAGVPKWIKALDSKRFAEREEAMKHLEKLGKIAESYLREALEAGPSAEQSQRLRTLLRKLDGGPPAEQVRALRAVEALEFNGTAEARAALTALAKGAERAPLTRDARSALARLAHP
jgi:WD40 repeat protein